MASGGGATTAAAAAAAEAAAAAAAAAGAAAGSGCTRARDERGRQYVHTDACEGWHALSLSNRTRMPALARTVCYGTYYGNIP